MVLAIQGKDGEAAAYLARPRKKLSVGIGWHLSSRKGTLPAPGRWISLGFESRAPGIWVAPLQHLFSLLPKARQRFVLETLGTELQHDER